MACVYRAEYNLFQIELSTNYGLTEWHDLKKVMLTAGVENTSSSVTRRSAILFGQVHNIVI